METKIPKSIIAGVQSVMPVEVTQHRKIRSISIGDPIGVGMFRRTLNIVMHYKQEGDSRERGWLIAGWIRESLGRALTEQPMISGRLRKAEDGLEVVANDSGVRLVEAMFPASFSDFLEMVKRDKSRAEAETVYWKDIDEDDPRFSPLFYVQVTNFESGGYSIGISCSIIIADLLLETDFLTKWSQIQTSLAHSQTTPKLIFHLPSIKQDPVRNSLLPELSRSDSVLDRGDLVVFRAKTCPEMLLPCMKKAVEKGSLDVILFVKEQSNGDSVKVEIHSRDEAISDCDCDCGGGELEETESGAIDKNLAFGKRYEVTSCWVGCVSKGVVLCLLCHLVLEMPNLLLHSQKSNRLISVTCDLHLSLFIYMIWLHDLSIYSSCKSCYVIISYI